MGVPELALGGIPLGFGIIVEDRPSECLVIIYMKPYHVIAPERILDLSATHIKNCVPLDNACTWHRMHLSFWQPSSCQ